MKRSFWCWLLKSSPWTSNISVTWKLVGNAESQAPPQNRHISKISRRFLSTLMFEEHCLNIFIILLSRLLLLYQLFIIQGIISTCHRPSIDTSRVNHFSRGMFLYVISSSDILVMLINWNHVHDFFWALS